jgi:hypothetical protein
MAVSTDFAPPFKLIAPYFMLGVLFYIGSIVYLFGIDVSNLSQFSPIALSFIHIFLLGCVMMIIFGAMAQLVPVVLEVGHFAVELYYVIYPLLALGTLLMGYGFLFSPIMLPFGGVVVLIAMGIFLFETMMTIQKVKKLNFVMKTVLIANIFLFFGLLFGVIMALGYGGIVAVDIEKYLISHIFLTFFGYVGITIMGMSLVLLPMFWLSHSFSWKSVEYSVYSFVGSVGLILFHLLFSSDMVLYGGYFLIVLSVVLYLYQIWLIYKTRVRKEKDIYFKSLIFSYTSLCAALLFGVSYLIFQSEKLLLLFAWVLLFGYIGNIITGHLYKIVPFLVWYQRFSPLIGKQKVPMLADMVPKLGATLQFNFTVLGVILCGFGIGFETNGLFYSGVSFLFVGGVFMFKNLLFMINFR